MECRTQEAETGGISIGTCLLKLRPESCSETGTQAFKVDEEEDFSVSVDPCSINNVTCTNLITNRTEPKIRTERR
jgi:hypothetical protein